MAEVEVAEVDLAADIPVSTPPFSALMRIKNHI